MTLRIGALADLGGLLGTPLAGSVDGSVVLAPARDKTRVQLELEGHDLNVAQVAGDLHVKAAGLSDAVDIELEADLPKLKGMPAKLSAAGTLDADAHALRVTSAAFAYRGETFKLEAPALVSYASGMAVDDFEVAAHGARFDLEGEIMPALNLRAALSHVGPDLINVFAPGLVNSAAISGQARLEGSSSNPTGELSLDATDVTFADDAATGLPAVQVHAHADLADGTATVRGSLAAGPNSEITVSGRAPLDADGALDLKIGGKMDVGLANPLLEARGLRAAGKLAVDATVTGTSAEPEVGGGINLTQGSLRDYVRGVNLSNIEAEVAGNQAGLEIKSFKATAVSGSVGMTGKFGLLLPGMPVDLEISAKNAQPVASSIVTANLDADIHVSGRARERLDVAGTVHVNRANISIPDSFPPEVAVLDVRRRGQVPAGSGAPGLVVAIDVTLKAPQEILVQGRGLDAELGGDIHFTGTSDEPVAEGSFDLQRGTFNLAGTRLDFTDGRVSFDGAGLRRKIDPTLDFTAKTTISDTTVQLRITGVADAPQFDFSSTPQLPQDEIMARLLFGESAAQLTALQVAQIGAALATLSGVGGNGLNPLVKLQKALGLDRLTVGANTTTSATGAPETSGAAIAAGRYVTKRVYVEGKQTTTGTSQVQVDVDLTKHLKLQTRLGNGTATVQGTTPENDPGSSVGLIYQFEY
jgi:translocation and assembly module TamB